jgi:hypothetical protein
VRQGVGKICLLFAIIVQSRAALLFVPLLNEGEHGRIVMLSLITPFPMKQGLRLRHACFLAPL